MNPITENIQNASTIWKDAFGWLTYVLVAELCYGAYPKKKKSTHSTCNNETRIHDTSQRAKLYDGNLAMEIDSFPS